CFWEQRYGKSLTETAERAYGLVLVSELWLTHVRYVVTGPRMRNEQRKRSDARPWTCRGLVGRSCTSLPHLSPTWKLKPPDARRAVSRHLQLPANGTTTLYFSSLLLRSSRKPYPGFQRKVELRLGYRWPYSLSVLKQPHIVENPCPVAL